jgi:hypothetical protein
MCMYAQQCHASHCQETLNSSVAQARNHLRRRTGGSLATPAVTRLRCAAHATKTTLPSPQPMACTWLGVG